MEKQTCAMSARNGRKEKVLSVHVYITYKGSLPSTLDVVEDKKREKRKEMKNASHTWCQCYKKRQVRGPSTLLSHHEQWQARKLRWQPLVSSTMVENKESRQRPSSLRIGYKGGSQISQLQSPVTSTRPIMKPRHHNLSLSLSPSPHCSEKLQPSAPPPRAHHDEDA